jgi:flagellar hook protein FlgE
MGLQSALTTALTGLQGAETTIDVAGNNVANSSTVGFKESSVLFATQFLQTQSIGSAPTANTGGTNPRQTGLGVKVAEIAQNFSQGTIQVSSNPLDLAIQGDGFFIVADSKVANQSTGTAQALPELYTRNGQFKTNKDNEVVTSTGNRVLGYGVNANFQIQKNLLQPLTIPFGASAVAQATQNVVLQGNELSSAGGVSTKAGIIDSFVLGDNSFAAPTNLDPSDVQQVTAPDTTSATATAANHSLATPVEPGTYRYRITYVDPTAPVGNNESPPTDIIGSATIGAGQDSIDLAGIPSPPNANYTTMNIYRSQNGGNFLLDAAGVAPSSTYTDTTTQASIASNPTLDTNSLDKTSYTYFVTFASSTNVNLESRSTAQSATVTISNDNRRIRLDNLPQIPAGNTDFDQVKIYRSVVGHPGSYYLVDTLPAVGGVTPSSYVDNTPDATIIAGNKLLDRNGPQISPDTPLTHLSSFDGSTYTNLFALPSPTSTAVLNFTGSKGDPPLQLASKPFEIDSTTTVGELISFMQDALGIQNGVGGVGGSQGGSVQNSSIQFVSNEGIQNSLSIAQGAFKLSVDGGTQTNVPLGFASTQEADGAGSTTEIIAYDSLGNPLNVRVTTALESTANGQQTYRWFATTPDNVPTGDPTKDVATVVGTGLMSFDSSGAYVPSVTPATVSINRTGADATTPVLFNLDFTKVTALNQGAESVVQTASQDGFPAGTLSSFSITEDGIIKGVYSNGVTRDLGQIAMARFANNDGLVQVGNNLWSKGVNSGEPLKGTPGDSGLGSLTSGAVELSNADIGQNLIELILASTQYRGGARVITATQQLLDELLQLRTG